MLDVRYRSPGALLIAYASRLARAELFVEVDPPLLPVGTRTALRLQAPGARPLQVDGRVAWSRPVAVGPGLPAGVGITLLSSIEAQGAVIDELASRFRTTRLLVVSEQLSIRAVLVRYLQSILSCEIVEVAVPSDLAMMGTRIKTGLDMALIDLDGERGQGLTVLQLLMASGSTAGVPIIALARQEHDRANAGSLGVKDVLRTPPLFGDVRDAVIHGLSCPASCLIT